MTATATIRFARPGVRAPVFVVTSASTPPWALVEMLDSGDRTATGEIIFERTFDDIPRGAHQYKIRVGQDQWILEEDKETATDESGNRNNVVHSELKFSHGQPTIPDQVPGAVARHHDAAMQAETNTTTQGYEKEPQSREHRQDSAQWSHAPAPIVGANSFGKQNRVANDYTEQHAQEMSTSSVAGYGENVNAALSQPRVEPGTTEQAHVPLFSHETFVLESAESPLRFVGGESNQSSTDQTGSEAEIATPPEDELNGPCLSHELHRQQESSHDELDNAPRLPHETDPDVWSRSSIGNDDDFTTAPLLSHEKGLDADHQVEDAVTDELSNAPLFTHETETTAQSPIASESSGVECGPLMTPETDCYNGTGDSRGPSDPPSDFDSTPSSPSESGFSSPRVGGRDSHRHLSPEQKAAIKRKRRGMIIDTTPVPPGDGVSELDHAPLLSHEADNSPPTEASNDSGGELDRAPVMAHEASADEPVSELDRPPMMPHEANSSGEHSEESSAAGDSRFVPVFSRVAAAFSNDDEAHDEEEAPLLAHERPSPVRESSSSDLFRETGQLPAMTFRGPNSPPMFVRHTSSSLWKSRSTSSSLPHSLPRSDEEDENLNDPSLEPFPTGRQNILERVATISSHLPEDETLPSPNGLHSPAVMSQACSSVELAPVGSHTSLSRINEDAVLEGDEGDEEDVALGSPVMELSFRTTAGGAPAPTGDLEMDEFPTPMPHRRRSNYFDPDDQDQVGDHERHTGGSEADERTLVGSVYGHDGMGEGDLPVPSARRRWTPDALAQRAGPLSPVLTDPTTPERRRLFPWEFVHDQNEVDLQTALAHTPPRQRVYRSPLYLRAWRRLFAQHEFLSVAAVCGALLAAVWWWWWWWFQGGCLYGSRTV